MSAVTYVDPRGQVFGPYLTVQFKKADQDATAAVNQLATVAALILFNRVALHISLLNQYISPGQRTRTSADFAALKHYGLAFAEQFARIYIITPRLLDPARDKNGWNGNIDASNLWQGCTLQLLTSLDMTKVEDVYASLGQRDSKLGSG